MTKFPEYEVTYCEMYYTETIPAFVRHTNTLSTWTHNDIRVSNIIEDKRLYDDDEVPCLVMRLHKRRFLIPSVH